MEQLLEITNVPISFELKIHNAKLEVADTSTNQGIVDFTDLTLTGQSCILIPANSEIKQSTHQESIRSMTRRELRVPMKMKFSHP